jgi:hypothetical protein
VAGPPPELPSQLQAIALPPGPAVAAGGTAAKPATANSSGLGGAAAVGAREGGPSQRHWERIVEEFHDVNENFDEDLTDSESLPSSNFGSDIPEIDGDVYASAQEDGEDDTSTVDETSLKYLFRDSTWKDDHVTYDLEPR